MAERITSMKNKFDNRGMTMVEVLMGFTILVLLLGMFSGIIASSTDIYYNAVDLKNAGEHLQQAVYAKNVTETLTPESVTVSLIPDAGTLGDTSPIALSADLYKLDSTMVLDGVEEESLQVTVYFIKSAAAQGE